MATIQLREELFREMNPMLESDVMLRQMLSYVRTLFAKQHKTKTAETNVSYQSMAVSPEIEKWSGCVSFTEDEIHQDEKLQSILRK
ncbi:MAG: hypothetical protein IJ621_03235 [Paludibacteraceae bacterium]|nr:hypothetical protein [Paludibacteraceae bacterium]